jgi:hypothetical protein
VTKYPSKVTNPAPLKMASYLTARLAVRLASASSSAEACRVRFAFVGFVMTF